MYAYTTKLNRTPDWIIVREPYCLWSKDSIESGGEMYGGKCEFVLNSINENYEPIILNTTDYIYPLDEPHPRRHRFVTNKKHEILDRYEIYPLVIYRKIS